MVKHLVALDPTAEHQAKLDKALFRAVKWAVAGTLLAEATKQAHLSQFLIDTGVSKDSLDFFRYHLKDAFEGVWYNLWPVQVFRGHQRRKRQNLPEALRAPFEDARRAITKPLLPATTLTLSISVGWESTSVWLYKAPFDWTDLGCEVSGILFSAAYGWGAARRLDRARKSAQEVLSRPAATLDYK